MQQVVPNIIKIGVQFKINVYNAHQNNNGIQLHILVLIVVEITLIGVSQKINVIHVFLHSILIVYNVSHVKMGHIGMGLSVTHVIEQHNTIHNIGVINLINVSDVCIGIPYNKVVCIVMIAKILILKIIHVYNAMTVIHGIQ